MNERLQKLIAAAGLCSRRTAEEWIIRGKVTVNGNLARLGDTADPETDEILVEGRPLPKASARTATVLLYKPRGVVTTMQDEKGRPTVAELLPAELGRLYPVGRLDQFSEGLLLMTNDGALANRLTHPRGEVCKTYLLWVSGWHDGALEKLRRPIILDGYRIKPPQVRLIWAGGMQNDGSGVRDQGSGCGSGVRVQGSEPVGAVIGRPPETPESVGAVIGRPQPAETRKCLPLEGKVPPQGADEVVLRQRIASDGAPACAAAAARAGTALLEITIHEGRNRQIRRMAEAAGLKTTRLKRISEGPVQLGDLKPGQWRPLTAAELKRLAAESTEIEYGKP
jgi:23S rRNA pseudouridine2605 synthase